MKWQLKFKKPAAVMLATTIFASLVVGCGSTTSNTDNTANKTSPSAKKVTIRFAHNWTGADPKAPFFEKKLTEYQQKHPEIDLKLEATAGEEHRTKIKVDATAGNLPDIFTYWLGPVNLKPLQNQLLDMDQYLAKSKTIKKEQYTDVAWSFFDLEGKKYGMPLEAFKGFFMANRELFKKYNLEYPKTYADLQKVAKVFNDNGIVPFSMGSKNGQPSHLFFSYLAYQFANGFEDAQKIPQTYQYSTDAVKKAAKAVAQMKKDGIFPKDTVANGDWGPQLSLYNEQKAAMVYEFPWMIGNVKPEIVDKSDMINFPALEGSTVDPTSYTIGAVALGLVINKKSFEDPAKQQALVDFADYINSDEVLGEVAKGGLFPAKQVELDPKTLSPLYAKAVEFTKNQKVWPHHEGYVPSSNAYSVVLSSLDELFAGFITPEQYTDKTQKALDKAKK
jgi:raffinose/stachyose/melibiose transport system substrate-binding protein